ncbi:MAG: VWA domain-containing protein [Cyanobacteria bacterium SZAS-4]|nr:VWA domain-containing protein [Cyanobacteria bacterium SZAS-4]
MQIKQAKQVNPRSVKGQSMIALVMIVGLVTLPLIGIFTFEVGRLHLAKQQLQNASDAAALAAVATLASEDNLNPQAAHIDAMQTALGIFKKNFVLSTQLSQTAIASSANIVPANGSANIFFEFVNPLTMQVEPISSPNAKIVRVYSNFSTLTAFGKFVGIKDLNVNAISKGAVPQLDVIFCFDVSGSMDDQTPVTFVKRKWDQNKIVYEVANASNGKAEGKIFDVVQPGESGSSLNGAEPQLLDQAYWNSNMQFTETLARDAGVPGLRSLNGYPDQGKPPGNFPPGAAPTWDGYNAFTDLVVNIDGNQTFSGFTFNGFRFPDRATLVEAARGNLENQSVYIQSKAYTAVSVSPQAGYQNAYQQAAAARLQPMKDAKDASTMFTDIINTDTDCHFGFVAFDGEIGTSSNSTEDWYSIDQDVPYGPVKPFALPVVPLDAAPGNTNYATVNGAIKSCVALGSTNIGAAVDKAVQELKAHARPGSVKAIVLFTDGQPTTPAGPLDSDPWTNARKAAIEARDAGIPVYTIGLAQNQAIVAGETAILNDTNSDPANGGIAGIAGHGGTFNLVTNSSQLRKTFEKIARHLVELVASG